MSDDLPQRRVRGATGGDVYDGKWSVDPPEGGGVIRVMDPEHVEERLALNVARTATSLALSAAEGRAQLNGKGPADEAEKRRESR